MVASLEEEKTLAELLKKVDIVEVFSPPRVTTDAEKWGLRARDAMDLVTGWDSTLTRHRDAAKEYIRSVKPKLVSGSMHYVPNSAKSEPKILEPGQSATVD